jgi:molybdopterin/thiamine biosynthesis adenylyltransferase
MTRRHRWWQAGTRTIEVEAAWFAAEGLDFKLDQQFLTEHEVVVFRGNLRLGGQRCEAAVVYPASYGAGAQVAVIAPGLPLGRHISPDGTLCLDHPRLGQLDPMTGAEAVARAQRLWHMWQNDREALAREEADAPDPRANYFNYEQDSLVLSADADLAGHTRGYAHLNATSLWPLRARLARLCASHPGPAEITLAPSSDWFGGTTEVIAAWSRVHEPPPAKSDELMAWLHQHHRAHITRQIEFARQRADAENVPGMPAVCAFVYPDEGPDRGEAHDAWLYCVFSANGMMTLARSMVLSERERWVRQPQLSPMGERSAAILGIGALGSQIADQLAKAGIGRLVLVDHDILTVGNRVRHQLDLADLARAKVSAVAERLRRVNPWITVEILPLPLGLAVGNAQFDDDRISDALERCDVLVNATARSLTGSYVSLIANELVVPTIHVWVTAGAWGARFIRQRPGQSGCWDCFALSEQSPSPGVEIPALPHDPDASEVTDRGCADPTFTGPGFELAAAAAACTRFVVQTLLKDPHHYPQADYDVVSIAFRDELSARPTALYTDLPVHPDCEICAQLGAA